MTSPQEITRINAERLRLHSLLSLTRQRREYQRASLGIDATAKPMPESMLDDILPTIDVLTTTAQMLTYATNPATERAFIKMFRNIKTELPNVGYDTYGRNEHVNDYRKLVNAVARQYREASERHVLQQAQTIGRAGELEALLTYHGQAPNFATYFFLINHPTYFEEIWSKMEDRQQALNIIDKLHPRMLQLHTLLQP